MPWVKEMEMVHLCVGVYVCPPCSWAVPKTMAAAGFCHLVSVNNLWTTFMQVHYQAEV